MNRFARRHRSTKVPNVKLRPAPARSTESPALEESIVARYGRPRRDGDPDDDDDDDDSGPLIGCVLCMSGLAEEKVCSSVFLLFFSDIFSFKGQLCEIATSMGAVVEANLTESATHLIARTPGSEKYVSALKVGIPIMKPSWLYELRSHWTQAKKLDFEDVRASFKQGLRADTTLQIQDRCRLGTFENLTVGMAGITDKQKRHDMRSTIESHSGSAPIAFKLDGSYTHLLCGDTKSSQTLDVVYKYRRRAERFLRRGENPPDGEPGGTEMNAAIAIKLVRAEWMEDCVQVGGCLPERHYLIHEPVLTQEQRKEAIERILREQKDRWTVIRSKIRAVRQQTSGKRKEVDTDGDPSLGPRKAARRSKVEIGSLIKQITQHPLASQAEPLDSRPQQVSLRGRDSGCDVDAGEQRKNVALQEKGDTTFVAHEETIALQTPNEELEEDERAGLGDVREKSLADISFRVDLGTDAKNEAVQRSLHKHGVHKLMSPEDPQHAHFHVMPLSALSTRTKSAHLGIPVTHFFIERCLLEQRIIDVDDSFALQPATCAFPLPGTDSILVALTGLGTNEDGPDRHQVESALLHAGARTESTLKRGSHTHLLVGKLAHLPSSQAKIQKAKKWGIPVVGLDFVKRMYKEGVIFPACPTKQATEQTNGPCGTTNVSLDAAKLSETPNNATVSQPQTSSVTQCEEMAPDSDITHFPVSINRTQSQRSLHEMESLEAGTLAMNTSAHEILALLDSTSPDKSKVQGALKDLRQPSDRRPIKGRRQRPSMRPGFHRSSRTPTSDREGSTAHAEDDNGSTDMDPRLVEQILDKSREEEWHLSSQTAFMENAEVDDASLRVIYDDPAARRERRKMADLIGLAVRKRQQSDVVETDDAPHARIHQGSTPQASPTKKSAPSHTFSPSIKARKQPGTSLSRT